MLLGFKRRFVPFIEDGSKTHTIREHRMESPVGYRLDLYADPRQKSMRLLGRFRCTKAQAIELFLVGPFTPKRLGIRIDGQTLKRDEAMDFARRDGFRDPGRDPLQEMVDFWLEQGRSFPWSGDLIHWDLTVPMEKPVRPKRSSAAIRNGAASGGVR